MGGKRCGDTGKGGFNGDSGAGYPDRDQGSWRRHAHEDKSNNKGAKGGTDGGSFRSDAVVDDREWGAWRDPQPRNAGGWRDTDDRAHGKGGGGCGGGGGCRGGFPARGGGSGSLDLGSRLGGDASGAGSGGRGGAGWDNRAESAFGASALGSSWRGGQSHDGFKGSERSQRGQDSWGFGSSGGASGSRDDERRRVGEVNAGRSGNKGGAGGGGRCAEDSDWRGNEGGKHSNDDFKSDGKKGNSRKGGFGKDGKKGDPRHGDGGTAGCGKGGRTEFVREEKGNLAGKSGGKVDGSKGQSRIGLASFGMDGHGEKGKGHGAGKRGSKEADLDRAEKEEPPSAAPKKTGGSGAVSGRHLSTQKFSALPVSKETKRALAEGFGYDLMTEVQAQTVGPLLAGHDVVARAKTGTGKTLAFLVPIVEKLAGYGTGVGGGISAVILSPTRELAAQIAEEAQVLLRFHKQLGVACFYGGTKITGDHNALKNKPVDILVGTPGRMQDHIDNTPLFRARVGELYFLALDEADQLLDMGFRDSILKILKALPPPKDRQGALFSATFPAAVGEVAKLALKHEHDFLDTVKPDEEVTPDQIDQSVCVTDMEGMTELLWIVVNAEMRRLPKEYKIMVFFTTARSTQLYSELFGQARVQVLEVHSRKSQAHRNKCTQQFRESKTGIVFSSDVSARGLDYPDVTAVIQVGIPSAREQYIHRLGRTGRAGKSGRCILLLQEFEQFFLRSLKDLPIKRLSAKDFPGAPAAPNTLWEPKEPKTAGQAYQAWLGYYNSVKGLGWPKDQLVREATRFAASIGAVGRDGLPPPILKKTVGMMGLKGVPGLNIVSQLPYGD